MAPFPSLNYARGSGTAIWKFPKVLPQIIQVMDDIMDNIMDDHFCI